MFKYKGYGLVTKPTGAVKAVMAEITIDDLRGDTFMRRFMSKLRPFSDDGLIARINTLDAKVMKLREWYPHRIIGVIGGYLTLGVWLILAFFINVSVELYIGFRDGMRSLSYTYRSLGITGWGKRLGGFISRYFKLFSFGIRKAVGKLYQYHQDGEFAIFFRKVLLRLVVVFFVLVITAAFLQVNFGVNILKSTVWFDYEVTKGKQPVEAILESLKGDPTFGVNGLRIHDDSFGHYSYGSEMSNDEGILSKTERNVERDGAPYLFSSFIFVVLLVSGGEFFNAKFMRREISAWGKEKEIDERIQDEGSDADSPEQAVNKEDGHSVYESDRFMDLKIASWRRQFSKKQTEVITKEYSYTRTQTKGDRGRDFKSVDELMNSYEKGKEVYRKTRSVKKGPSPRFSAPYDASRKLRTDKK